MIEKDRNELIRLLELFFDESIFKNEIAYKDNINWNEKPGKIIKDNLIKINRWKKLPRGNSKKGFKNMIIKVNNW